MPEDSNNNDGGFDLSSLFGGGPAPVEPEAEFTEAMAQLYQSFIAARNVGFTEAQAMRIVETQITAAFGG